jgi:branched-subunit amino acid aminotransferase/4-amino-4-deoxychorismate lyase
LIRDDYGEIHRFARRIAKTKDHRVLFPTGTHGEQEMLRSRWVISPGLSSTLALFGTVALCLSWFRDTHDLTKARENLARLQRSQLVIDIDKVGRDQWLIAMDQEIAKAKPDPYFLAFASRGALEGAVRWATHMEGRVAASPEEYEQELKARDELLANAQKWEDARDYKNLNRVLGLLNQRMRSTAAVARLDKQFFDSIDAAQDKVARLERGVREWYIAGTGSLLPSTILASIFLEIGLRKIEIKIAKPKSR